MAPGARRAPQATSPVVVHGGTGGITAHCEEIGALARRFGAAASDSLHAAWSLHGYAAHPGLGLSALLDPVGYAAFETDLLDALDGPRGLSWVGLQCGVVDGELRVAAAAYEAADRVSTSARDAVTGVVGLPLALAGAGQALARTGDPIAAVQSVLAADPELADTVVDALAIPAMLAATAALVPDGHGVAHRLGEDTAGTAAVVPRRLTDVVGELAHRNDDLHHGAIDVRILTMADGSRRVIVDVTGTKSWTPLPTADVTSLTTNGRALVGRPTAYEGGVLAAMRAAGVHRGDPVMLVGHSEGGLVAVEAARDAEHSGEFTVTHVVTAGSPVGRTVAALPPKVKVLALENERDVIPHLDGVANPDLANVTTVSAPHGDGTVLDDHDLIDSYEPLAADVQASSNASVRDFLTSADGYFRATRVETVAFQVTRRY